MESAVGDRIRKANQARREGRFADARRDLEEAVLLLRRAGTPPELAPAVKALGQIERDLGQGGAALLLYEEAAVIDRGTADALALAHTVRHIGDIHRGAGRPDLAAPCYQEALALYRSNDPTDPLDLANALRPMAILEEAAGNTEAAAALWREARDLYARANVAEGAAECAARLDGLGA
ncbi:MAG TPA: tetratricopeptide repeat protein [Thermoanaerobaculia bacterium]|nr:tetratricopeptide repeat protein [Thermoanaerobaculia bacterium]